MHRAARSNHALEPERAFASYLAVFTPADLPLARTRDDTSPLTVRGYVQYVAPCDSGKGSGCQPYAAIVSTLAPTSEEQTFVYFAKPWPKSWPKAGACYEFDANYGGRDIGPRSVTVRALRKVVPDPSPTPAPTYPDGSWSIADLVRLDNGPRPGMQVSITASIAGGKFSAPCPPGAMCAPVLAYVIIADDPTQKQPTVELTAIQHELDRLLAGAKNLDATERTEVEARFAAMHAQAAELNEQLDAAESPSPFTWDQVRAGFAKPCGRLRAAVRDTRQWLAERRAL